MNKLWIICATLMCNCSTVRPVVLADVTRPSVMEETIKHNMETSQDPSYFWVLWYIPIVAVILSWAYKAFFTRTNTGTKHE